MSENKERLSEQELDQVLQFAQGLYNGLNGGYFWTPFSQNQNLLALNNNGQKPTQEKLSKALETAPYDYGSLASYSEFMEIWDAIYAKTLRYFSGLLSFDLSYTCKNIKNPSEYKSKEYKDDVKRVHKFLDNFDYKLEFNKVVKQLLRTETAYTWFRDTHEDINTPIDIEDGDSKIKRNEKFSLQIMPQNQCMLTGYFNCSQLLYDFNINYFLQPNVDINLYAPALKKKFKETFDEQGNYIPSAQLDSRNGSFAYWVQCSPNDGAYAFKFDISNFRQVPPFITLLKSCLNNDVIEEMQKNKDLISAYFIMAGEIETMQTDKSGQKANQFAITPQVLGQMMNLVTRGLKSNNILASAFPLKDIKGWQFTDSNPSMATNQYTNVAAQGASASSLIYTTSKMAQFEVENAVYADYCFMKPLYEQFNQFLNFYVNKKTVKYKFEFSFDGLDRQWDREKRQSALRNYADKGIVLDSTMWASAFGMKPQAFQRSLECAHNSDFVDNLTMMLNANTMKSGGQEDVGAPKKDISERSEKTEEVEDYVN